MNYGWPASKIIKLACPEMGIGGRRVTLRCRPTPSKADRRPPMTDVDFCGVRNDEIEPAVPMAGCEKLTQSQASSRPTGYAALEPASSKNRTRNLNGCFDLPVRRHECQVFKVAIVSKGH